jgi:hypothetical protein
MVGAPAVIASADKITVCDDLTVADGAAGAVSTMGGSTGRCLGTVGVGQ